MKNWKLWKKYVSEITISVTKFADPEWWLSDFLETFIKKRVSNFELVLTLIKGNGKISAGQPSYCIFSNVEFRESKFRHKTSYLRNIVSWVFLHFTFVWFYDYLAFLLALYKITWNIPILALNKVQCKHYPGLNIFSTETFLLSFYQITRGISIFTNFTIIVGSPTLFVNMINKFFHYNLLTREI